MDRYINPDSVNAILRSHQTYGKDLTIEEYIRDKNFYHLVFSDEPYVLAKNLSKLDKEKYQNIINQVKTSKI